MKRNLYTFLVILVLLPGALFSQSEKTSSPAYLQQIKREMNVRHNYAQALSLTRNAVRDYPRDVDFQYLLGQLYLLNKDTIKGERKLAEIIQKVPAYKDAYLAAASLQLAKGYKNKAIDLLNSGLNRFPGDYQLLNKKLNIYVATRDYTNADKQAGLLLNRFSNDSSVLRSYVNYHNEAGNYYLRLGNLNAAQMQFDLASAAAPGNQDALQGGLAVVIKKGNDENSLAYLNRLLILQPGSYSVWMKKIGLLQQLRRYPEAIETLKSMQKRFPSGGGRSSLGQELELEAARYYKKLDPYYQYLSVLEKSPSNKEALNNVITMAISRNMKEEALVWINKALSYTPDDTELLTRKMDLLEQMGKTGPARDIAAKIIRLSPSAAARTTYIDLELKRASDFAGQGLYDSAVMTYQSVLLLVPDHLQALNSSVNILALQKNYPAALLQIDRAINYYPADIQLQIKKAGILQESGANAPPRRFIKTYIRPTRITW